MYERAHCDQSDVGLVTVGADTEIASAEQDGLWRRPSVNGSVSSILGRIMVISVRLVMVVAGDGCEFK